MATCDVSKREQSSHEGPFDHFFAGTGLLVHVDVRSARRGILFARPARAGASPRGISSVSHNSVSIGPAASISKFDQRDLSALNLLGIRYAKGQGVNRDPGLAIRFFLLAALKGYTPAMANVGTLYEAGATGRPNQHRAYAWVRSALSFGVPEEDHDATVLKLGMIAARLGSSHIGAAERLAGALATRVVETCQCSPGQETKLASNGS